MCLASINKGRYYMKRLGYEVCVLSSYDLHKATKKFIAFEDIKDIAMRLYKSSSFLRRKFCYLFRTSKCPPFELLNYSWSDKLKGVHWRAQNYSKTLHLSQPQVRPHVQRFCNSFRKKNLNFYLPESWISFC